MHQIIYHSEYDQIDEQNYQSDQVACDNGQPVHLRPPFYRVRRRVVAG